MSIRWLKNKLSNNRKNLCCICYENRKKVIKCIDCNDGIVCNDCIIGLMEAGLSNRCPICRKKDPWKIKSNKIYPKGNTNVSQNESRYYKKKYNLYKFLLIIKPILPFIILFIFGIPSKLVIDNCLLNCHKKEIIIELLSIILYGLLTLIVLVSILIFSLIIMTLCYKLYKCDK